MAGLVTKKCPNCGAGLQLDAAAAQPYTVTCSFCRTSIMVYPPVRSRPGVPPPPRPVGPNVIVMDAGSGTAAGKTVGCIIVASVLLPIVLALFGSVGGPCVSYLNTRFSPWYFPAKCDANEEIVVRGRRETRSDVFFSGSDNCKIRLVDCDLTGATLVKGGSHVEVTLEHTTLHMSNAVIDNDSYGTLKVTDGSKVVADSAVVSGGSYMEVDVSGSTVQSKGVMVHAQSYGKVKAKGKSIISAGKAVVEGAYGEISLDASTAAVGGSAIRDSSENTKVVLANGSKLTSPSIPLSGGDYIDVDIDASQVEGGTGAIELGEHSNVHVRENAAVTAKAGDAIRMSDYGNVDVGAGSIVQAQKTAVRFKNYGTLKVNGGRLRGADAIYGESYTRVTLRHAIVEGQRTTGSHSQIDEE